MLKQWLRNKLAGPVYVDCYTDRKDVYDYAKIQPATRFYPNWWKRLKNKFGVDDEQNPGLEARYAGSMRHCMGFTELFRAAFCIPLWSDLRITVGPVGSNFHRWLFADKQSAAGVHSEKQRGDFLPNSHFQHLKLQTPWLLKCSEEVKFVFLDPSWTWGNEITDLIIPPGIIEFKYQAATNINMLIPRDAALPKMFDLKYGTPLAFLVPMTERRVILRHHLVSREKFALLGKPTLTFVNAYGTTKKKDQEQCPMKSK